MVTSSFISKYPHFFLKSIFRWKSFDVDLLYTFSKQLDDEFLESLSANPHVRKDAKLVIALNEISKSNNSEITFYNDKSDGSINEGNYNTEWRKFCYSKSTKYSHDKLIIVLHNFYQNSKVIDEPDFYYDEDDNCEIPSDSYELCAEFPWTANLISIFQDKINWKALSTNQKIDWNEELIDKYLSNWEWDNLSSNPAILWNNKMLEKYDCFIIWISAAKNNTFPWTFNLIDKYCPNTFSDIEILYKEFWRNICIHPKLEWTKFTIADYFNRIDYFVEDYDHIVDNEYFDEVGNKLKILDRHPLIWYLGFNENIEWDIELINKYYTHWNWNAFLSNKSLPWNNELIKLVLINSSQNEWHNLTRNEGIKFDLNILSEFEFVWDYEKLNWNIAYGDFIQKHEILLKALEIMLANTQNQYDNFENIYYTGQNQKIYSNDDQFNFGKYKGQVLRDVILKDPNYLYFCIRKVNFFILHPNELEKLKKDKTINFVPYDIDLLVITKWGYWCLGDAKTNKELENRSYNYGNDSQDWNDGRCPACLGNIPCGCNWANEQGW